jgi:hypothetical protein
MPTTYRDLKPGDRVYFNWRGPSTYLSVSDTGHDTCLAYKFRDSDGTNFDDYRRPSDPVYILRERD